MDKTGWRRDNPECSSEEYLTGNRICRWVDGTLIYFSRLIWEEMKKGGSQHFVIEIISKQCYFIKMDSWTT